MGELGARLVGNKTEGPTMRVSFLGIEPDTVAAMFNSRLPRNKLHHLQDMIATVVGPPKQLSKSFKHCWAILILHAEL